MRKRSKVYVGVLHGGVTREVFRSVETPTPESHGDRYGYTIGPFRTRRGADYFVAHPWVRCATDADKFAAAKARADRDHELWTGVKP